MKASIIPASIIPARTLEWFIERIGKEVNSVHGQNVVPVKIENKSDCQTMYLDAQWTFGVRFTDIENKKA